MSGRDNATYHDPHEGVPSSTESSQCTESTESRTSYTMPTRQSSKALLEKRRQDLPKASSLEQAYLRNSRKQVYYHPVQQKQQHISDNILKAMKTTHSYRIQQLENQVSADQIKINEYLTEIRTLKTQQKRLEVEIKKYQGMAGNIPNFMRVHEEDLRAVQCELKKAKRQGLQLNHTIVSREEEIRKLKQENERWRKLEDLRQLEDRGKLHERNEELKDEVARQNEKILMLTRKGMLEVKNLKHELANERKKHRETQQSLSMALASIEKLRAELEMKQKHITYNSLRFSSHPKKASQNGLESISLITLTGNRYGSMRNQVKLDPELASHYPKLSVAKPRNAVDNSMHVTANGSRSAPRSARFSVQESQNHLPMNVTSNVSIRKSPTIPLSDIQSDDDECSNLSEEDIDLYSSSNSRKDSLLTSSHKSVFGQMKDFAGASDSDSETQTISNKSRKNGCSLPNLASPEIRDKDNSCNGRHSCTSEKSASHGGRGLSVESEASASHVGRRNSSDSLKSAPHGVRQSSTDSLRSVSYGRGQSSDELSKGMSRGERRNSTSSPINERSLVSSELQSFSEKHDQENGQSNSILSESSSQVKADGMMDSEFPEVYEKVETDEVSKAEIDKVEIQHGEYLKFKQELKQEIDHISKGKLLAALDAIDKGEEPVILEPLRSCPKPASIFTATTTRTPTYEFDQVTEDLYRGRPTKRDKSPDGRVQITALDRFKSDSPLEHPRTKADLIKELFGVGKDADNAPNTKLDIVAPSRNIPYEPITFSDRNNNEPDGDAFYSGTRVTLTNWKH